MKTVLQQTPNFRHYTAAILAVSLLAFTAQARKGKHGTDILHFSVREAMVNNGALSNATGHVEASQNKQGNANNQKLSIGANHLDANAPYQLMAAIGDNPNLQFVSDVTSDADGRLNLQYRKVGNGHGLGHGRQALPALLDPVSSIRELVISMNTTQAVLTADLTAPDALQYLIKRDLSTDTVDATLRIKGTKNSTQFRLTASGLSASSDYLLAFNGSIVQTNTADAGGRLVISSLVSNPGDILDLHSVQLLDNSSNVVLTTTLP